MKTIKEMSEAKYKNVVNRHIFTTGGKAVVKELLDDLLKIPMEQATGEYMKGQSYAYKEIIAMLKKINVD